MSIFYKNNNIAKIYMQKNFVYVFNLIKKQSFLNQNKFILFSYLKNQIKNKKPKDSSIRRISNEMYKILKLSSFFFLILDTRNPIGTWNRVLVKKISSLKKKLIIILNKIDLVPSWVTSRWLKIFSKKNTTIPFHSNKKNYFGRNLLFKVIKNLKNQNFYKKKIIIGIIGYQGVGKSKLTAILKRQTKKTTLKHIKNRQLIKLSSEIFILDSPGILSRFSIEKKNFTHNNYKVSEFKKIGII